MTSKLAAGRFAAARTFVAERGRPLEAALLAQSLGDGSGEAVLEALAPFQNPDGGFGHGLEPDIPSPASSGLATSLGLRALVRAGAAADHPMVKRTVAWLGAHIEPARGVWPIIGPDVDLASHAPWWAWSDDLAANWNNFRFNPTAEILAHLYRFSAAVPPQLIAAAEAGVRQSLAEVELVEGAYDLKCAVRLAESGGLPAELAAALVALVNRSIAAHDPNDEHGSPLEFAATPRSLFAHAAAGRIDAALDGLIDAQAEDGGWNPFWDWSFVDAAAWGRAKHGWRGQLTREAIETLIAWDRVVVD